MKKYKPSKLALSNFFTMPYALFENPAYTDLPNEAKLLYGLFVDRISLSMKNGSDWIDENGEVFCYYTNDVLGKLLNRSEPHIINLKSKLHEAGLLLEVQQGQKKPNRIYPLELKTVKSGTKNCLVQELKTFKPNHTNINHTNINQPEIGKDGSTTEGGNTLFSKAKKEQATSSPAASNLSKFNNLILENFGKFPTPLQIDDMRYMLEEHQLDVITLAIKECVDYGKPRFSYLKTILDKWKHDGLTTAELVKNRLNPKVNRKQSIASNIPEWSKEHPDYKPSEQPKILSREEFLAQDD